MAFSASACRLFPAADLLAEEVESEPVYVEQKEKSYNTIDSMESFNNLIQNIIYKNKNIKYEYL